MAKKIITACTDSSNTLSPSNSFVHHIQQVGGNVVHVPNLLDISLGLLSSASSSLGQLNTKNFANNFVFSFPAIPCKSNFVLFDDVWYWMMVPIQLLIGQTIPPSGIQSKKQCFVFDVKKDNYVLNINLFN